MESGEERWQLDLQAAFQPGPVRPGMTCSHVKNAFQTGSERFLTWQFDKASV
jgi:hypothetical protein